MLNNLKSVIQLIIVFLKKNLWLEDKKGVLLSF